KSSSTFIGMFVKITGTNSKQLVIPILSANTNSKFTHFFPKPSGRIGKGAEDSSGHRFFTIVGNSTSVGIILGVFDHVAIIINNKLADWSRNQKFVHIESNSELVVIIKIYAVFSAKSHIHRNEISSGRTGVSNLTS